MLPALPWAQMEILMHVIFAAKGQNANAERYADLNNIALYAFEIG